MPSRRIVNASPLILLAKTGRLELLQFGGVDVIIPEIVVAEIEAGEGHDSTSPAIRQSSWLSVGSSPVIPEPVRACKLGQGETAVVALAHAPAQLRP